MQKKRYARGIREYLCRRLWTSTRKLGEDEEDSQLWDER
jgi:hypothetical protein